MTAVAHALSLAPLAALGAVWIAVVARAVRSRWARHLAARREVARATIALRELVASHAVHQPLLAYALGTLDIDLWVDRGVPPAAAPGVIALARLVEVAGRARSSTAVTLVLLAFAHMREEATVARRHTGGGAGPRRAARAGTRGQPLRYRLTMRPDDVPSDALRGREPPHPR